MTIMNSNNLACLSYKLKSIFCEGVKGTKGAKSSGGVETSLPMHIRSFARELAKLPAQNDIGKRVLTLYQGYAPLTVLHLPHNGDCNALLPLSAQGIWGLEGTKHMALIWSQQGKKKSMKWMDVKELAKQKCVEEGEGKVLGEDVGSVGEEDLAESRVYEGDVKGLENKEVDVGEGVQSVGDEGQAESKSSEGDVKVLGENEGGVGGGDADEGSESNVESWEK